MLLLLDRKRMRCCVVHSYRDIALAALILAAVADRPADYCQLHADNRPISYWNHSEQGQFAELPLKTIGKEKHLGDHYAIRSN